MGRQFTSYSSYADQVFLGGYLGRFQMLVLLVGMILNMLLGLYVCQWSYMFNIVYSWCDAGLGLIFLCACGYMSYRTDKDIHKLGGGQSPNPKGARTRANVATDLGFFGALFVWNIVEITIVMCYGWGNVGNLWLNANTSSVNYPLTSLHYVQPATTITIEHVAMRAFIHWEYVFKALVMFAVFFWATRLGAVRLYEHLAGHEGSSKAEMSSPLVGVAAGGDGRSKSVAKY